MWASDPSWFYERSLTLHTRHSISPKWCLLTDGVFTRSMQKSLLPSGPPLHFAFLCCCVVPTGLFFRHHPRANAPAFLDRFPYDPRKNPFGMLTGFLVSSNVVPQ